MWGRVSVTARPTLLPVSVAEAKTRGLIDGSDSDTDIGLMIKEAVSMLERANGIAFMTQSWRVTLDGFTSADHYAPAQDWRYSRMMHSTAYGTKEIKLPGIPIQSITSVKYLDADEAEQTASGSLYRLQENSIVLTNGSAWPATGPFKGAVYIDYVLGESDADNVEPSWKDAVTLLVKNRFDHGRDLLSKGAMTEMPFAVEAIMREYRQSWAGA